MNVMGRTTTFGPVASPHATSTVRPTRRPLATQLLMRYTMLSNPLRLHRGASQRVKLNGPLIWPPHDWGHAPTKLVIVALLRARNGRKGSAPGQIDRCGRLTDRA